MSIYKKFTAQDFSVVPFNAHKQYNFDVTSAASNKVTSFTSSWTSESIDIYSVATASHPYSLPFDNINAVKYNQIDHLFYRNFKKDIGVRFGNNHYLNQKRELYEKANILSIPTGLYGHEIKPGSFYLSSSAYEVVDDSNGNLIISGTNINNYPIDVRSNIFRLDPIKGFKNYDLNTFEEYAIPFENDENVRGAFWRDGEPRVNLIGTYDSPDQGEFDDSYFFNPIKYNKVTFTTSSISLTNSYFTNIYFNSNIGSNIISPDNEKFNFNPEDDFAISFNIIPEKPPTPKVGEYLQGGYVFHIEGDYAYIVSDKPIIDSRWSDTTGLTAGQLPNTNNTSYTNLIPTFDDGTTNVLYLTGSARDIGGGETNTNAWKAKIGFINGTVPKFPMVSTVSDLNYNGFNDWWIPNYDEWEEIIESLYTENKSFVDVFTFNTTTAPAGTFWDPISRAKGNDPLNIDSLLSKYLGAGPIPFNTAENFIVPLSNNHTTDISSILGVLPFQSSHFGWGFPGTSVGVVNGNLVSHHQHRTKNVELTGDPNHPRYVIWPVRKANIKENLDTRQRHIISKSTTKTIVPTPIEGQAKLLSTKVKGSSQFKDVQAQPQFPFEIYMISQSLYFERYDGEIRSQVIAEITKSADLAINNNAHILCQKTGSNIEIYLNGNFITSSIDFTAKQTQNEANIYIGSKGILSETEATNISNFSFFNGKIGNINIFEEAFNTASIKNISESINASPYIGNIFYQNGFATITHPKYQDILTKDNFAPNRNLLNVKFQGSHLIYEHEYQCTVDESEFNGTLNISARKIKSKQSEDLADFATGSLFKPYITTIGLYNEQNELLVVGKLGQPVKTSNETDTTFVLRWDT